jgi:ribosomal protein L11 methyltransferase
VHILCLECAPEDKDNLIAELWEHGTGGIVEEDLPGGGCGLKAFFDEPFEAGEWARHGPRWEAAEERDWVGVAQALWEPLVIGSRFFLVPAWRDDPTPPGRIRIVMHAGQAYGTGSGPTTQLTLEVMEQRLGAGDTVLDLGTGSGILAIAAARLGAGRVFGCDIDFDALRIAAERFAAEGIPAALFAGSVRSVRSASIDFVAANINAEVLIDLAAEIQRVLKPGGRAVLTGFPTHHLERVRAAFGGRGEVLEKGEWRGLIW